MNKQRHFVLYLDESGWGGNSIGAMKRFQLAGFVAPCENGNIEHLKTRHTTKINNLISKARVESGLTKDQVHHATDIPGNTEDTEKYRSFITKLVSEFPEDWTPVRILNQTGVRTGDPILDYTAMVGSIYCEVLTHLSLLHNLNQNDIRLHILYASVFLKEDDSGNPIFIEKNDYEKRIRIEILDSYLRSEKHESVKPENIGTLAYASAKNELTLIICDWLSNATYNKCRGDESLTNRLFPNTWMITYRFGLDHFSKRIASLMDFHQYGEVLKLLQSSNPSTQEDSHLENALEALSRLRKRDLLPQIQPILATWSQIVETERDPHFIEIAKWYEEVVFPTLLSKSVTNGNESFEETSLPWRFSLHVYALSSANHSGNFNAGAHHSNRIKELSKKLTGYWEHLPIYADGILRVAVHKTDLLHYDEAIDITRKFNDFYTEVAPFFSILGEIPEDLRSDFFAKTLSTESQAQMFKGVDYEEARRLNKLAISHFMDKFDVQQGEQYRTHLETLSGNFDEAKSALNRSLDLPETSTYTEIGNCIKEMQTDGRHFALMHWLRIGAFAAIATKTRNLQQNPSKEIYSLISSKKFINDMDSLSSLTRYPAHSIRRYYCGILAANGDIRKAEEQLLLYRELQNMDDSKSQIGSHVFEFICLAAQLEVSVLGYKATNDLQWLRKQLSEMKKNSSWLGIQERILRLNRYLKDKEPLNCFKQITSNIEEDLISIRNTKTFNENLLISLLSSTRKIPW